MARKKITVIGGTDIRAPIARNEGKAAPYFMAMRSTDNPWHPDSITLTAWEAKKLIAALASAIESVESGQDFRSEI
jgi:hypothetical protein